MATIYSMLIGQINAGNWEDLIAGILSLSDDEIISAMESISKARRERRRKK